MSVCSCVKVCNTRVGMLCMHVGVSGCLGRCQMSAER